MPVESPPQVRGLSVFFPAYNDSGTIASMVVNALLTARRITPDHEVIVINDGSRDITPQILDELARVYPQVKIVHHQKNRGYGGALRSGFETASKEFIFYTDGDAQYDAKEVAGLVPLATASVDIVQGYKVGRGDTWYRKAIGRFYHHVVKLIFRLGVRDTDCDFRLFRRRLFTERPLTSTSGVICVEMMYRFQQGGARFVEAPVGHFFRPHGRSQFFRIPAVARSARQLLTLWWRLVVRGG